MGCATDIQNVKHNYAFDISNNKGIVFGKTFFGIPKALQYRLRFVNLKDGKQHEIVAARFKDKVGSNFLEKDFFVELPAGDYQITRIQVGELSMWGMYVSNIDTKINFTVLPGAALYLGTLNYGYEPEKNYFFVKTGESFIWVSDEREEAIKLFQEQYPNLANRVEIGPMKLQEEEEEQATTKVRF